MDAATVAVAVVIVALVLRRALKPKTTCWDIGGADVALHFTRKHRNGSGS